MVTYDELNHLKWQRPFQPFRVTTINDEAYEVYSPKLFLVGGKQVNIGLPHPTEPPPMAGEVIGLWHDSIRSIELISTRTTPMVTFEEMNHLKWQRPFQPFRVTTVENEVFEVHTPKLFLVGSNEVNIGLPHPTEPPPAAGDIIWLGFGSIASVEMIGAALESNS